MRVVFGVVLVASLAAANTSSSLLTIEGKVLDPNFKIGERSNYLVNKIKADLRRDNDDYKESASQLAGAEHRRLLGTVPLRRGSSRRRLTTDETSTPSFRFKPRFTIIAAENPPRSVSTPGFLPREKLDKMKQFLHKNKGLLKRFVSYKRLLQTARVAREMGATSPMPAVSVVTLSPPPQLGLSVPQSAAAPVPPSMPPPAPASPGLLGVTPAQPTPRPRKQRRPHRPLGHIDVNDALANLEESDSHEKLLDMSPARVIVGRMCHRNVLIPEGPKYDAQGRIYLKEFSTPRPGLDYARTKPPTYLLPRCCNCCRKSVLGCE